MGQIEKINGMCIGTVLGYLPSGKHFFITTIASFFFHFYLTDLPSGKNIKLKCFNEYLIDS